MFKRPLFQAAARSARVGDAPWALAQVRHEFSTLKLQRQEFARRCVIPHAWKEHFRSTERRVESTFLSIGDQRVKRIEWLLDNMGVTRSDEQRMFHQDQVNGLLPWCYGSQWASVADRVMRERGVTTIPSLILTFARRRVGKTYAISMLCLAVLLTIPGFEVTVFSTGGRISSKLMACCRAFANKIEGATDRIYITGEQMFVLPDTGRPPIGGKRGIPFADGVSVMNAYPSDSRSKTRSLCTHTDIRTALLLQTCVSRHSNHNKDTAARLFQLV